MRVVGVGGASGCWLEVDVEVEDVKEGLGWLCGDRGFVVVEAVVVGGVGFGAGGGADGFVGR